ncbi:MAG: GrpB family protein [Thermomicrobiales bacterium]
MDRQREEAVIGPYQPVPVACLPWDPRAPEAANRVIILIGERLPMVAVDHVGSTAVPGCAGKGVLDLLLRYPPSYLSTARDALDDLGFQHQGGRSPWPEERPMRVGSIRHDGTVFQLHVHVVAEGDPDAEELLRFRDALRADPALVAGYVAAKQAVLAAAAAKGDVYVSGDAMEYVRAKEPFIQQALGAAGNPDKQTR